MACRQYPPVLEVLGELLTVVDAVKRIAHPGHEEQSNCTALAARMQPSKHGIHATFSRK